MTYPLYPGFLGFYVHKMLVNGCDFWLFKQKNHFGGTKNQRLYDNQTIPKHLSNSSVGVDNSKTNEPFSWTFAASTAGQL